MSYSSVLDSSTWFYLTVVTQKNNLSFWMIIGEQHQDCMSEEAHPASNSSWRLHFLAWKVSFPNPYCDKQQPLKRARERPDVLWLDSITCHWITSQETNSFITFNLHYLSFWSLIADAILQPFFFFIINLLCVWLSERASLVSLPEVLVHRLPEDQVAQSAPGCQYRPVWCRQVGIRLRRKSRITCFESSLSGTMGR